MDLRTRDPGTGDPRTLGAGTQIGMHCAFTYGSLKYPGPHVEWVCVSNRSTGMYTGPVEWAIGFYQKNI